MTEQSEEHAAPRPDDWAKWLVRVRPAQADLLRSLAAERDRSCSSLIREAVAAFLQREYAGRDGSTAL